MRPPSISKTLSKLISRLGFGCVATMRVRPRMAEPVSNSSWMCWPVATSTEAKGSSITTSSASMYAARAKLTRARWPPESRMP
mmetsp:Transcript_14104/g.49686  ORF Transcript_14104/g.49686 Transcript_14104/m.49686 type:complete len:83 (+) Transcript_14104:2322-2570(+)